MMTEFRIADTFTDSLARLTGDEQKAVKLTAFELQMNPASPGMSFHKLDKARDKNFWSVRVNADIRIIVHKTAGRMLLCYVNHHDDAYDWAERRKLEAHPNTGVAQLVEIRETVKEIVVPMYVAAEQPAMQKRPVFIGVPDEVFLGYGVPVEWINDLRHVDEDGLLLLAERLPAEAAEALLELATGGKPLKAGAASARPENPFEHPDARRRFRLISTHEELERALEFPWDKWSVFLHPEQRQWIECEYGGPARISGSAGTGKTIVALHRAAHLARIHPEARVLLATFSDPLAHALRAKLRRLVGNEPRLAERIEVNSLIAVGLRLHKSLCGAATLVGRDELRKLMQSAVDAADAGGFSLHFLMAEWSEIVDAWQLENWGAYRDVARLGRKTRLPEGRRQALWPIFDRVRVGLNERGLLTEASVFARLAAIINQTGKPPFDFAVVDEAQDLTVSQMRFLAALGGDRPDALFFTGDLGQRIFQPPFSWKSLGVDLRGRSRTLRVNYRTSHQIRQQADRLLGPEIADVDGNTERRTDTISVFNGPPPAVRLFPEQEEEARTVGAWLNERVNAGIPPHEIGLFVRSEAQRPRAEAAVNQSGLAFQILNEQMETVPGKVSISTMHLAKGLEFRAVAVMACDDEVLPLQARIETVGDDSDLKEIYDTERQLLYVACTRARDQLIITATEPASEFLDDFAVSSNGPDSEARKLPQGSLGASRPKKA